MAITMAETAVLFQQKLDKSREVALTSGWMQGGFLARQAKYTGGSTIKIPNLVTDGLGNYSVTDGYTTGGATLSYETFTMKHDRAKQFRLDEKEVDDSNFAVTAMSLMKEFQDKHVVPETDSYRYSSIAQSIQTKAVNNVKYSEAITAQNVLSKLQGDIQDVLDLGATGVVVSISGAVYKLLIASTEIQKQLSVVENINGVVHTGIKQLDEAIISRVPSARIKTAYNFGKTGFEALSTALDVNWIITPMDAPIAVSKTDKIKIFTPDVVQDFDGWKLNYHVFDDLFLTTNGAKASLLSTSGAKPSQVAVNTFTDENGRQAVTNTSNGSGTNGLNVG